jgi:hypothetical protein
MAFSRVASTPVAVYEPDRADTLAAELDQQHIGDATNRWIVHVLGVHNDGRHLWIQIAPNADGTQSFVLRLSMSATARHALAALAALSRSSLGCPSVVPVMCTV